MTKLTVAEAGRKGGLKTKETHGSYFYQEIGSKGGKNRSSKSCSNQKKKATVNLSKGTMTVQEAGSRGGERTSVTHGLQFYQEIGRKGGETTLIERGPGFYSKIGSKGGGRRWKK